MRLKFIEARRNQIELSKIVNGYQDIDRSMFFKFKKAVEPEDTKQH